MIDEEAKAKAEALKRLAACHSGDIEADHYNADEALVCFLRRLGHDDLVDAWEKVRKWYA